MNLDSLIAYKDTAIELALAYAPKLLLAILTLLVGLRVISGVARAVRRRAKKSGVDATLAPFLTSLVTWGLKALLLISVASMVGIETTSFIAVLGAAGLAVGLALQGSLANLAGGVLILVFRPFKVGDLLDAQGHLGVVKEIQIFTTTLLTPQNRRVIIPNGALSNGAMTNLSAEPRGRIDLVFGVEYGASIDQAQALMMGVLKAHPKVLEDPAPTVAVMELADSSVNFAVRPWVKTEDYWEVFFDLQAAIKKALDAAKISIPFPQRDVHIFNN